MTRFVAFLHHLRFRLSSSSGESIVETLAAVLISSLAVVMLFSAVLSAARMNSAADAAASAERAAAQASEQQESTHDYRTVTVDGFSESYTVEYFGAGTSAASYRYAEDVNRWTL